MVEIKTANNEYRDQIEALFIKYAAWLDSEELSEKIHKEIKNFPGEYGAPYGCCFIAFVDDQPAGCIAFRKWKDDICEMKRLYVDPHFRGARLGHMLIEHLLANAGEMGYKKIRLDVIASRMPHAEALYRSFGFQEIKQYGPTPGEGAKYFERDL